MSCTCGRSPTGKCVGWHKLSEEEYQEKKIVWEAKQKAKENERKSKEILQLSQRNSGKITENHRKSRKIRENPKKILRKHRKS